MISKSERKNTTIKIDEKQYNGLKLKGKKIDRSAAYVLKQALRSIGTEELTNEQYELKLEALSRRNSAIEVAV